jgi:hypothetical protein
VRSAEPHPRRPAGVDAHVDPRRYAQLLSS